MTIRTAALRSSPRESVTLPGAPERPGSRQSSKHPAAGREVHLQRPVVRTEDGFEKRSANARTDDSGRSEVKVARRRRQRPTGSSLGRTLEARGVAYPTFSDETNAQGNVETTYAVLSRKARTVFVSVDDANRNGSGFVGISEPEKVFVHEAVAYAQCQGFAAVVNAHIPPSTRGRHKNETRDVQAVRAWIAGLRREYPNTLFVFGHVHPEQTRMDTSDPDVDLDGGTPDVHEIIIGGEVKSDFAKISLFERGKLIEDFKVDPSGVATRVAVERLSSAGCPVAADAELGAVCGVTYAFSDVQASESLDPYFNAIKRDADLEAGCGREIFYLFAGDLHVDQGHIPVRLPQHEHILWAPGNHCYTDHASLNDVIDFLEPPGGGVDFLVDYRHRGDPTHVPVPLRG